MGKIETVFTTVSFRWPADARRKVAKDQAKRTADQPAASGQPSHRFEPPDLRIGPLPPEPGDCFQTPPLGTDDGSG